MIDMLLMPPNCSFNSLKICEKSIKNYLGSKVLRDFRLSAIVLVDLLNQLNELGITIHISANEAGLNYELKDTKGKLLPGCQFYGTKDYKASVILKTAIARGFYFANKQYKPQMELIK